MEIFLPNRYKKPLTQLPIGMSYGEHEEMVNSSMKKLNITIDTKGGRIMMFRGVEKNTFQVTVFYGGHTGNRIGIDVDMNVSCVSYGKGIPLTHPLSNVRFDTWKKIHNQIITDLNEQFFKNGTRI